MNIDIRDEITLDDGQDYIVISKINYQGKTYDYIVSINDNTNIKFCYENPEKHSIVEVLDQEMIKKLLPLFAENSVELLKSFNKLED